MGTVPTLSSRPHLYLDIETFSDLDLRRCGVHRYVESPAFRVLLIGWALDDGSASVLDVTEGGERGDLFSPLFSADVVKVAHNADFERVCLERFFGRPIPGGWIDTCHLARMSGLPSSLEAVGEAIGLKERGKMREGKALIRAFCVPKPDGSAAKPADAPEKWAKFKDYCARDVEVCRTVHRRLELFRPQGIERRICEVDRRINDRGIAVDLSLVAQALRWAKDDARQALKQLRDLTGLDNPNSPAQFRTWLQAQGVAVTSTDRKARGEIVNNPTTSPVVRQALKLKERLSNATVKKYDAIGASVCADGRLRGLLAYYGASRTGRWAGRRVQLQNLKRNNITDLDGARSALRSGDREAFDRATEGLTLSEAVSQLVRTVLVPAEGKKFLVLDYSSIEARVLAWLAGSVETLKAFARGEDIYCKTASLMFGVPVEKHGLNAHLRAKGKIAVLACGYGGGVGALKAFGADKMGMTEDDMADLVRRWRSANPQVVSLWRGLEQTARQAVRLGKGGAVRGVWVNFGGRCLYVRLPSGRSLVYRDFGVDRQGLVYTGAQQGKADFGQVRTHGGKLTENVVQAIARDCLAEALVRLEDAGFAVVAHVHDEVIIEADPSADLEEARKVMSQPLSWAKGLSLPADGYQCDYYRKE